jgi:hypothetical protein
MNEAVHLNSTLKRHATVNLSQDKEERGNPPELLRYAHISLVLLQDRQHNKFVINKSNITILIFVYFYILLHVSNQPPPLLSSGQSFWLQILRSWIRFRALLDFLRSRGSGTGSTQLREDK